MQEVRGSKGDHGSMSGKKVSDLIEGNRRLVEVPYTASLAQTMTTLVANNVVAVPVAAPPGHWIGAGGSMILESDKQTGEVRKHYIGIATMLDILAHIAGGDGDGHANTDLDKKMSVPVSSIIGHSLEGLSLWTLNPNTSILDCMEVLSKGIHRALIPLDSQMENVSGVELVEASPGYRMLTQMDLVRFLKEHSSEMQGIMSPSVGESGAVNVNVYAISGTTTVMDAIKSMRAGLLTAVPIVVATNPAEGNSGLIDGRGKKLIGTFSATDLRRCHLTSLQTWLPLTALEFTEHISSSPIYSGTNVSNAGGKELVACRTNSPISEVMDKVVTKHVHRIWVVDQQGLLIGLVSLTDIIRVLREWLLSTEQ